MQQQFLNGFRLRLIAKCKNSLVFCMVFRILKSTVTRKMNSFEPPTDSQSFVNLSKGKRRSRTTFDPAQIRVLESVFESTQYPDIGIRDKLANEINLPEARIQVRIKNL